MYAAAFFRLLQWHNALFIRVLSNAMFMSTIQYALFARFAHFARKDDEV